MSRPPDDAVSFFEDDEEPTRTRPRPRRPSAGAMRAPDERTVRTRRLIVAGIGVLLFLLLLFGVRGCLDSRADNALRDYNRELAALLRESDTQVAEPFFALLGEGGSESPQDLATNISSYRVTAQQQLQQARSFDVPDEVTAAHRSALVALELRRDGLEAIAQQIRTALGDEGDATDEAIADIASQMGAFLASDVLLQARTTPLIAAALREREITGQRPASTRNFLEGTDWLSEETVAERLGQSLSGAAGEDGEPAPGLHGTGIDSVSVGDVTLEAGAANRIPLSADAMTVSFTNQGENDEFDVDVVVEIQPAGGDVIRLRRAVDTVAQGQTAEVSIPLDEKPAAGAPVTISAEVRPVPGEEMLDNNTVEYQALFVE